ncbi:MAG: hypothetical protein JSW61_12310 [Candidatus Thorarchaeota archaeon]|nr:MAG: hypothetical protein JSW61_12310 [Candidatus Thorarchaeota archaeon]
MLTIIGLTVMISVLLMPKPVSAAHDPEGEQANSGTWEDGEFSAFVASGYDSDIWVHVSCYDYYGDLYLKGESGYWDGLNILDPLI